MIYHNFPVFPGLTYQLMTKFSIRERERGGGDGGGLGSTMY